MRATGLVPHVEASVGLARLEADLNGVGSFDEGNVAIGVGVMVGLGSLSAEISTGDVFKDVRSTQVSVGYALRF